MSECLVSDLPGALSFVRKLFLPHIPMGLDVRMKTL